MNDTLRVSRAEREQEEVRYDGTCQCFSDCSVGGDERDGGRALSLYPTLPLLHTPTIPRSHTNLHVKRVPVQ